MEQNVVRAPRFNRESVGRIRVSSDALDSSRALPVPQVLITEVFGASGIVQPIGESPIQKDIGKLRCCNRKARGCASRCCGLHGG